jgi:YfiH family protein
VIRQDSHGLVTYQFEKLAIDGLVHAVFTRLGGVSQGDLATLNVGRTVGDDQAAVAENHARILAYLDLHPEQVVTPSMIHGNRIGIVTAGDTGKIIPRTDGLATEAPGVVLFLRFADCQPILLYDPANHAVALIHAGWRGIAQGIARRAVEKMQEAFGSQPHEIVAGLGPAIGPCCYTVGDDVASAMGYVLTDWRQAMTLEGSGLWRFDLSAANVQQLMAAGVQEIEQANLCTSCHSDEFFSHRASNGRTGRFAVVAYLRPREGKANTRTVKATRTRSRPRPMEGMVSPEPPGFPSFNELLGDDK